MVTVTGRDVLAGMAELFINPQIAFGWKSHINLEYNDKKGPYGNLRQSPWFKATLERVKNEHPHLDQDNIMLLPIIGYHDGCIVGHSMTVNAVPAVVTCGLFSDELQRKDYAKVK